MSNKGRYRHAHVREVVSDFVLITEMFPLCPSTWWIPVGGAVLSVVIPALVFLIPGILALRVFLPVLTRETMGFLFHLLLRLFSWKPVAGWVMRTLAEGDDFVRDTSVVVSDVLALTFLCWLLVSFPIVMSLRIVWMCLTLVRCRCIMFLSRYQWSRAGQRRPLARRPPRASPGGRPAADHRACGCPAADSPDPGPAGRRRRGTVLIRMGVKEKRLGRALSVWCLYCRVLLAVTLSVFVSCVVIVFLSHFFSVVYHVLYGTLVLLVPVFYLVYGVLFVLGVMLICTLGFGLIVFERNGHVFFGGTISLFTVAEPVRIRSVISVVGRVSLLLKRVDLRTVFLLFKGSFCGVCVYFREVCSPTCFFVLTSCFSGWSRLVPFLRMIVRFGGSMLFRCVTLSSGLSLNFYCASCSGCACCSDRRRI